MMAEVVAEVALADPAAVGSVRSDHRGVEGAGRCTDSQLWLASVLGWVLAPVKRDQRGMVTIEWLIGLLVVLAMAGLVIAAITTGNLNQLVTGFIKFAVGQAKELWS
jgi:hypothetical protein